MPTNGDAHPRLSRRALLQCLAASAFACAHHPRRVTSVCGFYSERRTLFSFDNLHHVDAHIVWPQTPEDLSTLLRCLPRGRRLTFRSGGKSIDEQALNDDIVVMLTAERFSFVGEVEMEPDGVAVITVGASATWRSVLAKTTAAGFVPMAVPSAAGITAGGGLSSHSISRFSPVWQKEGNHVRRVFVMLADGTTRTLRRDAPAGSDEYELFLGVVAGLGFLAAILTVTYELLRVAPRGAQVQVATRTSLLDPRDEWLDLCLLLKERAEATRVALPPVLNLGTYGPGGANAGGPIAEPTPTVYASLWWSACGRRMRAEIGESRYVYDRDLTPMLLYEPDNELMGVVEGLLMSNPWVDRAIQDVAIDLFASGAVAVTTADGFSFFQDANVLLRERERGDAAIVVMQQTFLFGDAASGAAFLADLDDFVRGPHEQPTLCDLLWIPQDTHPFCLSATALKGAFALTLTYLRRDDSFAERLKLDLRALSVLCRAHRGTIHLVKSVEVDSQSELEDTYHPQFERFRDLKRRYDPEGKLVNNFGRRVFGVWPPPAAPAVAP
ncbi:MAG: oxidoreductase, FAD-binding [Myxococcaceae bacterium]|nr:oxidoreductase, FAD-binding [Myxococcaceae bacterium]